MNILKGIFPERPTNEGDKKGEDQIVGVQAFILDKVKKAYNDCNLGDQSDCLICMYARIPGNRSLVLSAYRDYTAGIYSILMGSSSNISEKLIYIPAVGDVIYTCGLKSNVISYSYFNNPEIVLNHAQKMIDTFEGNDDFYEIL